MNKALAQLRTNYASSQELNKADVAKNPIVQFGNWFKEVLEADLIEPNAMTLATVDSKGRPSARMVLLKGFDKRGFTFYTNYRSRKARELHGNSNACLVFWWDILARQVRIEGFVEKVSTQESDEYFQSREVGSKLGAWASKQSETLTSRAELDQHYDEVNRRYQGREIPRPTHWGGYLLIPHNIEFWQGRKNRLHDRIRYHHSHDDQWLIERLAP